MRSPVCAVALWRCLCIVGCGLRPARCRRDAGQRQGAAVRHRDRRDPRCARALRPGARADARHPPHRRRAHLRAGDEGVRARASRTRRCRIGQGRRSRGVGRVGASCSTRRHRGRPARAGRCPAGPTTSARLAAGLAGLAALTRVRAQPRQTRASAPAARRRPCPAARRARQVGAQDRLAGEAGALGDRLGGALPVAASRSIRSSPRSRSPSADQPDRPGGVALAAGVAAPASSRPRPARAPRRSASARSSRAARRRPPATIANGALSPAKAAS